jgi:non-heme chloroperoxidase
MDRLHEIHVPTLIVHGKQDKSAPYPLAVAMSNGIQNSKMLTFKGGHIFFVFHPQKFQTAITDFLSTQAK